MSVRAENLVVTFRRRLFGRPFTALAAVSLDVREGDFFALLGQNGAGKSTAMHCFVGLLRPTAGHVEVLGRPPKPGAALFRDVGYLPEEPRYHEYLTVTEAVMYYARLSGLRAPQTRVSELLDRLGLAEHRDLPLRRCSKGMKQKVGIAQCVIHAPKLLFLDEPMRGLDPMTVHLFRDMLVELNRQGTTIVMNSHILSEVELVATRVAIIHRGRVVAQDDISQLIHRDRDRYTVEVESLSRPVPYLTDVREGPTTVCGTLEAEDLHTFMEYARANGARILSCAIQKGTLEQSFVEIVTGSAANA